MSYSNDTKPSGAAWSNDAKAPMPTFSNDSKPSTATSYLLKEDAFYLLLETGERIVLAYAAGYLNDAKPS